MDKLIIDGYSFANSRDAKLAQKEQNAISKLQDSIDINNTEVYLKLIISLYQKITFKLL